MTWRWCYDSSLSGLCFQSLMIVLLSTNGDINCFPAADWWPWLDSCQRALLALQDWHCVPGAHPVRLQHRGEHQVRGQPAGDQHERRHLRRQEGPAPRLRHGAARGIGDILFGGEVLVRLGSEKQANTGSDHGCRREAGTDTHRAGCVNEKQVCRWAWCFKMHLISRQGSP